MNDFNRKVEDASARVSKTVADAAERIEKEIPEFIKYLNDEVVPAVRQHARSSTNWPTTWSSKKRRGSEIQRHISGIAPRKPQFVAGSFALFRLWPSQESSRCCTFASTDDRAFAGHLASSRGGEA